MKIIRALPMLLILVVSCGESTDTNIADGWTAFEDGRYEESQSFFSAALSSDPKAANEGLGWSEMKLGDNAQARSYFLASLAVDTDTLIGVMAGLAIVSWSEHFYQESLDGANFALFREPTFTFEYDVTIAATMLTLVKAYDHYHLGQYSNCLTSIQVLDPTFPSTTDPQALLNKLDALSATGS